MDDEFTGVHGDQPDPTTVEYDFGGFGDTDGYGDGYGYGDGVGDGHGSGHGLGGPSPLDCG